MKIVNGFGIVNKDGELVSTHLDPLNSIIGEDDLQFSVFADEETAEAAMDSDGEDGDQIVPVTISWQE